MAARAGLEGAARARRGRGGSRRARRRWAARPRGPARAPKPLPPLLCTVQPSRSGTTRSARSRWSRCWAGGPSETLSSRRWAGNPPWTCSRQAPARQRGCRCSGRAGRVLAGPGAAALERAGVGARRVRHTAHQGVTALPTTSTASVAARRMAQELAPTARAPPCLPSWRVSPQQMRMQLLDLNAACQTYYGEADWGPTVAYRSYNNFANNSMICASRERVPVLSRDRAAPAALLALWCRCSVVRRSAARGLCAARAAPAWAALTRGPPLPAARRLLAHERRRLLPGRLGRAPGVHRPHRRHRQADRHRQLRPSRLRQPRGAL